MNFERIALDMFYGKRKHFSIRNVAEMLYGVVLGGCLLLQLNFLIQYLLIYLKGLHDDLLQNQRAFIVSSAILSLIYFILFILWLFRFVSKFKETKNQTPVLSVVVHAALLIIGMLFCMFGILDIDLYFYRYFHLVENEPMPLPPLLGIFQLFICFVCFRENIRFLLSKPIINNVDKSPDEFKQENCSNEAIE